MNPNVLLPSLEICQMPPTYHLSRTYIRFSLDEMLIFPSNIPHQNHSIHLTVRRANMFFFSILRLPSAFHLPKKRFSNGIQISFFSSFEFLGTRESMRLRCSITPFFLFHFKSLEEITAKLIFSLLFASNRFLCFFFLLLRWLPTDSRAKNFLPLSKFFFSSFLSRVRVYAEFYPCMHECPQ